jgi:hypothetical protein
MTYLMGIEHVLSLAGRDINDALNEIKIFCHPCDTLDLQSILVYSGCYQKTS